MLAGTDENKDVTGGDYGSVIQLGIIHSFGHILRHLTSVCSGMKKTHFKIFRISWTQYIPINKSIRKWESSNNKTRCWISATRLTIFNQDLLSLHQEFVLDMRELRTTNAKRHIWVSKELKPFIEARKHANV